ncbi:MAG: ATP-binding protein [Methyloligellaceae bacterium]
MKNLLEAALDHIKHGVVICDQDLVVVQINRRAREILEVPNDIFSVGEPFENLARINAEHGGYGGAGSVEERVAKRMAMARTFASFRQDQQLFNGNFVEVYGHPIPGGGYVLTYTDITGRIDAEKSARDSENRFRDFADASSDWLWETDAELRLSYVSDRFADQSGIAISEYIGKRHGELDGNAMDEAQSAAFQEATAKHKPFKDISFMRTTAMGEQKYFAISGVPVFDEEKTFLGYRGTGSDITTEKLFEIQLERAKTEAEAASRAKSDFLANMSHELRTPLNAIIGYAELLQEEAGDRNDKVLKEDLTKVQNAGKHLLGLINNVLDLSKVEAGKMDVSFDLVDLDVLITEVADTAQPLVLERDNTFQVDNTAEVRKFITDSQKLRQMLLNLLSNAAKFTHSGEVRLAVHQNGPDWLQFEVSDTGVGMTKDQLSDLFEPFTQADPSVARRFGGTGLGLALCKRFADMLSGRLFVESVEGVGSRFIFNLPFQPADAGRTTARTA